MVLKERLRNGEFVDRDVGYRGAVPDFFPRHPDLRPHRSEELGGTDDARPPLWGGWGGNTNDQTLVTGIF